MPSQKKRKPLSARELANLRPNPQNLRRGKKPKDLTITQMDYCVHRAKGVAVTQACLELGLTPWTGRNWESQNIFVKQLIAEYKEQLKINRFESVADKIEMRTEFADRHAIRLIQKAKKPDMAVAKLIHSSWQRTGAIQSSSVSVSATAGAQASAVAAKGTTAFEVYEADWLTKRKQQMAAQLEQKHGLLNSSTQSE